MADDPSTILDNPPALPEPSDALDAVLEAGLDPAPAAPTDDESSRAFEAEVAACAVDAIVLPVEYDGIDTRTAEGNYASRSNIVTP